MVSVFPHNNKEVQSFSTVHYASSLEKTFALQMHLAWFVPMCRLKGLFFCSKSPWNSVAGIFFFSSCTCEKDTWYFAAEHSQLFHYTTLVIHFINCQFSLIQPKRKCETWSDLASALGKKEKLIEVFEMCPLYGWVKVNVSFILWLVYGRHRLKMGGNDKMLTGRHISHGTVLGTVPPLDSGVHKVKNEPKQASEEWLSKKAAVTPHMLHLWLQINSLARVRPSCYEVPPHQWNALSH